LNARNDWPKRNRVIDTDKFIRNGCVVNIKCGQSHCKFQLTAYRYHYEPEDFDPPSSTATINADIQDDKSVSGSIHCYKPNNDELLQVKQSCLKYCFTKNDLFHVAF